MDNTQDKPEVGSAPEVKAQGKVQNKVQSSTKKPATGRGWRLLTVFLLLVIIAGGGALGWFGQTLWLERASSTQTVAQQTALIETLQQNIERKTAEQTRLVATFNGKLEALREEQQSQLELLERNGDAGRGKHLLDEAEFLIRLANQRLQVERSPKGAQSLLESADQVLAKLDDPGLISLRKTLSENIAALRRTTIIDREGIFLRIGALSDLVMTFSALPAHGLDVVEAVDESIPTDETIGMLEEERWYQNLWHNLRQATQGFVDRHFHVRSLEQPLAPLMSIDREAQLRHSLLIILGNAQQAVLREEAGIYRASLARAEKDIAQYFAANDDTRAIIEQLQALQAEAVQQGLPDISASLYTLRDYRDAGESRFGNGEG
ncbi:MAG: uroporphyrinogen-III C-methyltransferase [Candidatus Reddybacter sp.]